MIRKPTLGAPPPEADAAPAEPASSDASPKPKKHKKKLTAKDAAHAALKTPATESNSAPPATTTGLVPEIGDAAMYRLIASR